MFLFSLVYFVFNAFLLCVLASASHLCFIRSVRGDDLEPTKGGNKLSDDSVRGAVAAAVVAAVN